MRKRPIALVVFCMLAALIYPLMVEVRARCALDDANFSHRTYWWTSTAATTLKSDDREVDYLDWVCRFPKLEVLDVTSDEDDLGDICSLRPLKTLSQSLRVLRLSGVRGTAVFRAIPTLDAVEEVQLTYCDFREPTHADLADLLRAFPKLKSLQIYRTGDANRGQIVYDPTRQEIVYYQDDYEEYGLTPLIVRRNQQYNEWGAP